MVEAKRRRNRSSLEKSGDDSGNGKSDVDSSSSSSSSSQSSTPPPSYIFAGNSYPTYQEMVEAKRRRNRDLLERSGLVEAARQTKVGVLSSLKPAISAARNENVRKIKRKWVGDGSSKEWRSDTSPIRRRGRSIDLLPTRKSRRLAGVDAEDVYIETESVRGDKITLGGSAATLLSSRFRCAGVGGNDDAKSCASSITSVGSRGGPKASLANFRFERLDGRDTGAASCPKPYRKAMSEAMREYYASAYGGVDHMGGGGLYVGGEVAGEGGSEHSLHHHSESHRRHIDELDSMILRARNMGRKMNMQDGIEKSSILNGHSYRDCHSNLKGTRMMMHYSFTPKLGRPRGYRPTDLLTSDDKMDLIAALEDVLMRGHRVRAREGMLGQFMENMIDLWESDDEEEDDDGDNDEKSSTDGSVDHGDRSGGHVSDFIEKVRLIHAGDSRIYCGVELYPFRGRTNFCAANGLEVASARAGWPAEEKDLERREKEVAKKCRRWQKQMNVFPEGSIGSGAEYRASFNDCEAHDGDDDNEGIIPNVALLNSYDEEQDYCSDDNSVFDASRYLDDPVKYNARVRKWHHRYIHDGPDGHWDREHGDGFDPTAFTIEHCATVQPAHVHKFRLGRLSSQRRSNMVKEEKYASHNEEDGTDKHRSATSALLQRCWERAVHAVSSSVVVPIASRQGDANLSSEAVVIGGLAHGIETGNDQPEKEGGDMADKRRDDILDKINAESQASCIEHICLSLGVPIPASLDTQGHGSIEDGSFFRQTSDSQNVDIKNYKCPCCESEEFGSADELRCHMLDLAISNSVAVDSDDKDSTKSAPRQEWCRRNSDVPGQLRSSCAEILLEDQYRDHTETVLHNKAMNVVDSVLHVVLTGATSEIEKNKKESRVGCYVKAISAGNGRTNSGSRKKKKTVCDTRQRQFNWRDVLQFLHATMERSLGDKGEQTISLQTIAVDRGLLPIPLNRLSFKALSMRLFERYAVQRMPT